MACPPTCNVKKTHEQSKIELKASYNPRLVHLSDVGREYGISMEDDRATYCNRLLRLFVDQCKEFEEQVATLFLRISETEKAINGPNVTLSTVVGSYKCKHKRYIVSQVVKNYIDLHHNAARSSKDDEEYWKQMASETERFSRALLPSS